MVVSSDVGGGGSEVGGGGGSSLVVVGCGGSFCSNWPIGLAFGNCSTGRSCGTRS
ncbi:hypothetical protein [Saccharopolyspora gregorii]|uniref:hypothetical protein n=1 Tax=Saccharopolyspora gregorii TaxID=33914 RepID=UPI0031F1C3B4